LGVNSEPEFKEFLFVTAVGLIIVVVVVAVEVTVVVVLEVETVSFEVDSVEASTLDASVLMV
jgi:hypothetical protein